MSEEKKRFIKLEPEETEVKIKSYKQPRICCLEFREMVILGTYEFDPEENAWYEFHQPLMIKLLERCPFCDKSLIKKK